jgi:hypothetical protein
LSFSFITCILKSLNRKLPSPITQS